VLDKLDYCSSVRNLEEFTGKNYKVLPRPLSRPQILHALGLLLPLLPRTSPFHI